MRYKRISSLFCVLLLWGCFFSNPTSVNVNHNELTKDQEQDSIQRSVKHDTLLQLDTLDRYDTLIIRDTLLQADTLIEYDTVIFWDTLLQPDTLLFRDTITKHDTIVECDTVCTQQCELPQTKTNDLSNGFRYYRFRILDMKVGGGANGGKTTNTRFILGDQKYPKDTSYTVLSVDSSPNPWGVPHIFDDTAGLHQNTGGYLTIDRGDLPWEWVIDLRSSYVFEYFVHDWVEPSYYKVPTNVEIYGKETLAGNWILIGQEKYSSPYDRDSVVLNYPK